MRLKLDEKDFVIAGEIHRTELSLPISVIHDEKQVAYVAGLINDFKP